MRWDADCRDALWRAGVSASLLGGFVLYRPPDRPAFSLCAFLWLTGRPCPFCGLTRGLCAVAKGDWRRAIHFNALTPLVFALLAGLLATSLLAIFSCKIPWPRRNLWPLLGLVFLAYGCLRVLRIA